MAEPTIVAGSGLRQRLVAWLATVSKYGWPFASFLIAALISTPIIVVVASVGGDSEGVWRHLVETRLAIYLKNTVVLAVGVSLICLVIGVVCAWAVTLCQFPGKQFFSWALLLPLAVPTYLIAYAYTDLLQFSGPLQTWLREFFGWTRGEYWFPDVRSLPGAIVMLSAVLYPYVYLAARAAFVEQSVCVLEASRTLGMNPWRSFFRVALPLARPSVAAGLLLVVMETIAEFGAVDYCAVDTFATGIYRTWMAHGSITGAAQLSSCLLMIILAVVVLEKFLRRRARHYQMTYRYRELPTWHLRGWSCSLAIFVCSMPILVGFILPATLFAYKAWQFGDPQSSELLKLGTHTFSLAVVASLLAVALALIIAYGKRLRSTPVMNLSAIVAGLGYAVPGGVIAIGILIPLVWFDQQLADFLQSLFRKPIPLLLSGTVVAMIFGYQVRFMAVALNVTDSGLARIRPSLDDAARTLGASGARTLMRVHLPLIYGSLLAAVLLVFVDVAKELPATLILRPFDFDTLAVRVYQLASQERLAEASTGALAIILVGLIPVILISRGIHRSRPGSSFGALDNSI